MAGVPCKAAVERVAVRVRSRAAALGGLHWHPVILAVSSQTLLHLTVRPNGEIHRTTPEDQRLQRAPRYRRSRHRPLQQGVQCQEAECAQKVQKVRRRSVDEFILIKRASEQRARGCSAAHAKSEFSFGWRGNELGCRRWRA